MIKEINIYSSTLYYYLQKKKSEKLRNSYNYNLEYKKDFELFIKSLNSRKLFAHIALSSIKTFSEESNLYNYLKLLLLENFECITTNGFTPYVNRKWSFDPKKDSPIYGAFAKLMFQENLFRNIDPLFSVCGIGNVNLSRSVMSFTQNGLFQEMINQNYSCLNIGLKYVTCSMLHLIETEMNVPYINKEISDVSMVIDGNQEILSYEHYNYAKNLSLNGYIRWNKRKLMRDLRNAKILNEKKFGDVQVYHFKLNRFYEMVKEKVRRDPFYLVTW